MKFWKPLLVSFATVAAVATTAPAHAANEVEPEITLETVSDVQLLTGGKLTASDSLLLERLLEDGTWAVVGATWISCPGVTPPWEEPKKNADKKKPKSSNGWCSAEATYVLDAGQYRAVLSRVDEPAPWVTPELTVN